MINMGYLIPSPSRTLKEIFKEKIHGTEKYLVSAELIAYLKWLIYEADFKDRGQFVAMWIMYISTTRSFCF